MTDARAVIRGVRGGVSDPAPVAVSQAVVVAPFAADVPAGAMTVEPAPAGQVAVDLASSPPDDVAMLHVFPHTMEGQRRAYSVLGVNPRGALPASRPRGRPRIALSQLAQGVDPETSRLPTQILGVMNEWSQENRDVARWLRELRAGEPRLRVVVLDHTGYELPWELLTIPPRTHEGRREYLGVAMPTARWQSVLDPVTFDDVALEFDATDLCGDIVAFVDSAGLAGGGPEATRLQALGARLEQRLRDLRERLLARQEGVALVYVATHGHWADNVLDLSIGPESDSLRLAVLRETPLDSLRASSAIVFLNVCHSGRMFEEHEFVDSDRLRGFPEVFLGHGAIGVIATTGWVDDGYAGEFAEWVLRRLCDEPAIPVSELLREWRQLVSRELNADAGERERLRMLTAFMYVYYGNPCASLRLEEPRDA